MREIIYRGKCIDETCLKGEWLYGQILHDGITGKYYIHMDNCLNESDNVGEEGLLRFVAYEVNPETICQSTGLEDKNGRRFGWDIFQASDGEYIQRYIIVWDENALGWSAQCITNPDGTLPLSEFRVGEVEVIGNIFDNPEMLKGERKR